MKTEEQMWAEFKALLPELAPDMTNEGYYLLDEGNLYWLWGRATQTCAAAYEAQLAEKDAGIANLQRMMLEKGASTIKNNELIIEKLKEIEKNSVAINEKFAKKDAEIARLREALEQAQTACQLAGLWDEAEDIKQALEQSS